MSKNKNNQAIWGKRITNKTSSLFEKVGNSVNIDKKLFNCTCRNVISTKNSIF